MPRPPDQTDLLPHDLPAEQAVLGAMLVDNTTIPAVVGMMKPEHFYRSGHAEIFKVIANLQAQGTPADLVTLCANLSRRKTLESSGGHIRIAALVDGIPKAARAVHYARIVIAAYRRRVLHESAIALSEAALNGSDPTEAARQVLLAAKPWLSPKESADA